MSPAPEQLRSILILRYSALGDVILATSVLDPLKARFPDAKIEWVVDAAYASLLDGLPQLHRVHALKPRQGASLRRLLGEVRGRFDLAIDLQNKVRTRVIAFAAADRTVRFVKRNADDALKALIGKDRVIDRAPATELYVEALAPLGVGKPGELHVHLSDAAKAEAAQAFGNVDRAPVAIAPGARWETKRWAPERYAEVANALHERGELIALCGGPGDLDVLEAFKKSCRAPIAVDLTRSSVAGLAAGIARCKLLIANDSGPVHLATALKVPSIVLFGPTSMQRWAPPPPSRAVSLNLSCSPCTNHGSHECPLGHHDCMKKLPSSLVLSAVDELLTRGAAAAALRPDR